jgi:hypothetical protein
MSNWTHDNASIGTDIDVSGMEGRIMGKYGDVAILAVTLVQSASLNARDAWDRSCQKIFPVNRSSREKGCPKGAFLGLCEEGFIKGVKKGQYTRSVKNKAYAIRAVDILRKQPHIASSEMILWRYIIDDTDTAYNQQMDVVISLWQNQLLNV